MEDDAAELGIHVDEDADKLFGDDAAASGSWSEFLNQLGVGSQAESGVLAGVLRGPK